MFLHSWLLRLKMRSVKMRDKNINRIVPDQYRDIRAQYEISNDPIENEEYD